MASYSGGLSPRQVFLIGLHEGMQCGLCQNNQFEEYYTDSKRNWTYYRCESCDFVFRDPETLLSPDLEKQRYETHNNGIHNEGYVRFLTPAVELIAPFLRDKEFGLDYGCGPGPILDQLFAKKDIHVFNYDPYFYDDKNLLSQQYDFITCTEVFEHLYNPFEVLNRWQELLKPGGYLLLMTEHRRDPEHFAGWGYRTDNTHVCFLNDTSLSFICENWGYELISCDGRLSLLRKN